MNRLRQLREEKGYSLRELGLKLNMNASVLGNYERGDRQPRIDVWEKLADFFEVTPAYMMGLSSKKNDDDLTLSLVHDDYEKEKAKNISKLVHDLDSKLVLLGFSPERDNMVGSEELLSNIVNLLRNSSLS